MIPLTQQQIISGIVGEILPGTKIEGSTNDLFPGKVTKSAVYVAVGMVAELPAIELWQMTEKQIESLYLLAFEIAKHNEIRAKSKRGRKSTVYHHMSSGTLLRSHGCKLGRFRFIAKRDNMVAIAYNLAHWNSNHEAMGETTREVRVILPNGEVRSRRI